MSLGYEYENGLPDVRGLGVAFGCSLWSDWLRRNAVMIVVFGWGCCVGCGGCGVPGVRLTYREGSRASEMGVR